MPTEEAQQLDEAEVDLISSPIADEEEEDNALTAGLWIKENPDLATKKITDNIADAFNALSVEDREKATLKMYGIQGDQSAGSSFWSQGCGDIEEKTPEFIKENLEGFEEELHRLQASAPSWSLKIGAIEMAEAQNPAYVKNQEFRLKFLRTEQWDTTKAAARFIRHFDYRMELFGAHCLGRDVAFEDLNKEDVRALKKGYYQVLPTRDRAGRAVCFGVYEGQTYESLESACRVNYYIVSQMDEETEERGVVSVVFHLQDIKFKFQPSSFVEVSSKLFRLGSDMPFRFEAFHSLMDSEGPKEEHDRVDRDTSLINEDVMSRHSAKFGQYDDWMQQIMVHGIPRDAVPFTKQRKIKNKSCMETVEMMRKAEVLAKKSGTLLAEAPYIILPSRRDVLFGKGRPIQFSSGNQRLSLYIDRYVDQYHNRSNKEEKTALANMIVQEAKEHRVRFLSKESGVWQEVGDDLAREKVSHMFRHQRSNTSQNPGAGLVDQQITGTIRGSRPQEDPLPGTDELVTKLAVDGSVDTKRTKL